MAKADKITWTLDSVSSSYRAVVNGRRIWVARFDAGDWRYGTIGPRPIADNVTSIESNAMYECVFYAPRKHLAMQDAITLAMALTPADRPTVELHFGRESIGWHFSPAQRLAWREAELAEAARGREDDATIAELAAHCADPETPDSYLDDKRRRLMDALGVTPRPDMTADFALLRRALGVVDAEITRRTFG